MSAQLPSKPDSEQEIQQDNEKYDAAAVLSEIIIKCCSNFL